MNSVDLVIAIGAMTLATLFTRAFPFLLFSIRKPPEAVLKTARLIPGAVMLVLVFTSLPIPVSLSEFFARAGDWISWIAVLVVAGLHLLLRHPLVSILGGTAFYMLMLAVFQGA